MSYPHYYSVFQIVDFIEKCKCPRRNREFKSRVELFIGTYCEFPPEGLFIELLFKALHYIVNQKEAFKIPSFEESDEIVIAYENFMNSYCDEAYDLRFNEDSYGAQAELREQATIRGVYPNPVHTFVREFSRKGEWETDFGNAVYHFVNIEYPIHFARMEYLIKNKLVEF